MLSVLFRFYLQIELCFSQLHRKSQLSNHFSVREKNRMMAINLEVI